MIPIKKNIEPSDLTEFRSKCVQQALPSSHAYKRFRRNRKLYNLVKHAIVEEQGGLCAYCMCQIPRLDVDEGIADISIEHVVAQHPTDRQDVGQGIDYHNLIAVCNGNRASREHGHRLEDLTCDAHKGNQDFRKINPFDESTLKSIFYTENGLIDSTDEEVRADLIDLLNLNCPTSPITAERKAALDVLIDMLEDVSDEDILQKCQAYQLKLKSETTTKTPFAGILLWKLHKLIEKHQGKETHGI